MVPKRQEGIVFIGFVVVVVVVALVAGNVTDAEVSSLVSQQVTGPDQEDDDFVGCAFSERKS